MTGYAIAASCLSAYEYKGQKIGSNHMKQVWAIIIARGPLWEGRI